MSKKQKVAASIAAALTLFTSVSPAFAGCVGSNRGNPHADEYGATKHMIKSQAKNTWQDWFWRGKNHGYVFKCPTNNADATCPINLDFTTGTSHSKQIGFSFGGGAEWKKLAEWSLNASFNYSMQKTWSNSFSFRPGGSIKRGQFAEPITVQVRRWMTGYHKGGWVETSTQRVAGGRSVHWCYDFDQNKTFGTWTTNQAHGAAYHTLHIY